jgi:four helix bundle protein
MQNAEVEGRDGERKRGRMETKASDGSGRAWDLRERTKQFALMILKFCAMLPPTPEGNLVRGQLLRCGTSPGAQYREASRGRSRAEFISKSESCLQELDESAFWLELTRDGNIMPEPKVRPVLMEVNELIAIFAASVNTAKANREK